MNWREQIGLEEMKRERPPRGAVMVVVVGLVACVVAAFATTGKGEGEAAHLEFVQTAKIPDSESVTVPGGSQQMQLVNGLIRSTGANISGRNVFQTANVLEIEAGAPIAESHIICTIKAPKGAEIGQSSGGLRMLYPRSSEDGIYTQPVPEAVLVDFSSHGSELAVLEIEGLPKNFTTEKGVKVEWPEYEAGTEHLDYFIVGKPKHDLRLAFNSIWRSTVVPEAKISCTAKTDAGKATVGTKGALKHLPPPIDEEAEEHEQERREEEDEAAEEEADEAGGEAE